MYYSGGGTEEYFGLPDLVPADGGLQLDKDSDGEDQKDMEVDQVEENDPRLYEEHLNGTIVDAIEVIVFPTPAPHFEYNVANGTCQYQRPYIDNSILGLPPQVLQALAGYTEEMEKQKAGVCMQPCIPLIVHRSPIVSFFEGAKVFEKDRKAPPAVWKPKYVSFVTSAMQLHQFYIACMGGLFKLHVDVVPKLEQINTEFELQLRNMETVQNKRLDDIYSAAATRSSNETMADFISLFENYAFQYLHLYEYVIYACLIAPRCDLPVDAILTPHDTPNLSDALASERNDILTQTAVFFRFKAQIRANQEADNARQGVESTDAMPIVAMDPETLAINRQNCGALIYRELIPLRTLYEYFCYMDCDGALRKANWTWDPR